MKVRNEVETFTALGCLPDSSASEEIIALHQRHLEKITPPVTDDEAMLLMGSFGSDDCFGLTWSLLHLIETAPGGAPLASKPHETENEWIRRLWERSHR